MDSFCCPRCLRVSHSPADVAAGWCGSCCAVTRIEGLEVVMAVHDGEWSCPRCRAQYVTPPSFAGPPLCRCGQRMNALARPEAITSGPLSPASLEQARQYAGLAVSPLGLQEAAAQQFTVPAPAFSSFSVPRAAEQFTVADLHSLRAGDVLRLSAAGSFIFDVPQQSYAVIEETVADLHSLRDLTMTVSAPLTLAQISDLLGLPRPDCAPEDIDLLLAVNPIVMEGLILNHYGPPPDEEGEIPWSDPATWRPGYTEL